jgi:hypothetical protein
MMFDWVPQNEALELGEAKKAMDLDAPHTGQSML